MPFQRSRPPKKSSSPTEICLRKRSSSPKESSSPRNRRLRRRLSVPRVRLYEEVCLSEECVGMKKSVCPKGISLSEGTSPKEPLRLESSSLTGVFRSDRSLALRQRILRSDKESSAATSRTH